MESKTTSKTSSLKALLLRAWRERWTDLQWGINIKTVLPRGVSGDVYNLADCILQQAVVGAGANQLVLSYLRHSLSAQLVSHAAVLQRLSKYNQFSKIFCVLSLLEFLEKMIPGVTCCSKLEETELATAILSTACWLLNIMDKCNGTSELNKKATTLALNILKTILNDDFYISMMCLARYNDTELYAETSHKCTEMLSFLSETDESYQYVKKLENVNVNMLRLKVTNEKWPGALIPYWLEVKLVGNPASSTASLVQQLKLFQRLKNYTDGRLFAELIRGSLLALYDVNQTSHESQWGAFAFLKVPRILSELAKKSDTLSIIKSIELLLQHTPLLDALDANSACSNLECLLGELTKIKLLTDVQMKLLLDKRKLPETIKLDHGNGTAGIPKVIIWAEPTLNGILKTLASEYKDALLGMLNQVLAGKSFELILAVATVQGELPTLVSRLIRFNECSKSIGDKSRAQLFDISFLMLVAIVQNFGTNAFIDQDGTSLVEQWVKVCMVEKNRPKAPEQLLKLGDPAITETLLQQFNAGETEIKMNVKWQDVLFNIPRVMHEVLIAWEQGALAAADVKRILDALRGRMCCLPLAAAAWLCAYMRTAQQDTLLKPVNMVQQLLAPPTTDEESLRDRWQLTCEIIRKMQRDVQLPLPSKSGHHLVSRQPAVEQLHQLWTQAVTRGWLDHTSTRAVHCLLETAGSKWLVTSVIQELCKLKYKDQLSRGVDLALGIFHVDIVGCTFELLTHVLPQLLYNSLQADLLKDPQMTALAYLTSYCVHTSFDSLSDVSDEPPVKRINLSDASEEIQMDNLISKLRQLFTLFDGGIQEGLITQQTYFAFYLIQSLVEVSCPSSSAILGAIPHALISDLLKTLPEMFSYSLLLHLHDVRTSGGKINMARDLCILRNHHLRGIPSDNIM